MKGMEGKRLRVPARHAMTEAEKKIEFLGGQIHALMGFALAVINTHPAPARLSRNLDFVGQTTLAHAEGSLVTDAYVDGVQDVQDRLKRGVEMALQQQAPPNKD
jgi:hypothetical protein